MPYGDFLDKLAQGFGNVGNAISDAGSEAAAGFKRGWEDPWGRKAEANQKANQQVLGYLGLDVPGINAPIPPYAAPAPQQSQPVMQAGGIGTPLPPQNENPDLKKRVQDWEAKADIIRNEPSLDLPRKMALVGDINRQLDNWDPQKRYRRETTQMTPIDKVRALKVSYDDERGIAIGMNSKGEPTFHNLPDKEEKLPDTMEGRLGHFHANTIRDPQTGTLFTYNGKARKYEVLHEPKPAEDKEALAAAKQQETDLKDEQKFEDTLEKQYEQQNAAQMKHVHDTFSHLAGLKEGEQFLSPDQVRKRAAALHTPEALARHYEFNQEAIDAHRAKFEEYKARRMAEFRAKRDMRRSGIMTMAPLSAPMKPMAPSAGTQQKPVAAPEATGISSPADALQRKPLAPIAAPPPEQQPGNVILQSMF